MATLWAKIVSEHDPTTIEFVGTTLVQGLFFWAPSFFYISLSSNFPSFSAKHKIQPTEKQPSRADIRECMQVVFRNQLITAGIGVLSIAAAQGGGNPSAFRVTAALPSPFEFVRDLILCFIGREILFYYAHRLLHIPKLYRAVHKVHHRFTAPVALSAQYAHPVEHILSNTLPIAIPPMALRSHILTMWVFLAVMLLETSTVHSGYDFFAGAARKHDAHHKLSNVNFGGRGWLDWLHGTGESKKPMKKLRLN
ncbi:sterol desaturase [Thozetella sp. PMI_491]|nr:sterol desaturase [Thozetella sp. PMI_491]